VSDQGEPLARIADALERLAPPDPGGIDWRAAPGYVWDGMTAHPVTQIDALAIDRLRGIKSQRSAAHDNIARLAMGHGAHDMLLWGARGMGKSALVRAASVAVQEEHPRALTLVQLAPGKLASFPTLLTALSNHDRAVLLFIDDLGFGSGDTQEVLALRSLLDGGIVPRPPHIRLAVTANRRAITPRSADEGAALHPGDERDNALALADRFGLTLGFHPADRETYLAILRSYTEPARLRFDEEEALAWAIDRGNRSGRTAYQFAIELAGRAGVALAG
jgi:uncharacterized protein